MVYKYICLGWLNPEKKGEITGWFHDNCALAFNAIGAGKNAEETQDKVPENIKCTWCGKPFES